MAKEGKVGKAHRAAGPSSEWFKTVTFFLFKP